MHMRMRIDPSGRDMIRETEVMTLDLPRRVYAAIILILLSKLSVSRPV